MLSQGTEEPTWRYIDPDGNVQGPFSAREMHTWLESNYLQMELPICGMVCNCSQLLLLAKYLPAYLLLIYEGCSIRELTYVALGLQTYWP